MSGLKIPARSVATHQAAEPSPGGKQPGVNSQRRFLAKRKAIQARHPIGLAKRPDTIVTLAIDLEKGSLKGSRRSSALLAAATLSESETVFETSKKTSEEAKEALQTAEHPLVTEFENAAHDRHINAVNALGLLRQVEGLSENTTTGAIIASTSGLHRPPSVTDVIEPTGTASPPSTRASSKRKTLERLDIGKPLGPRSMPTPDAAKKRKMRTPLSEISSFPNILAPAPQNPLTTSKLLTKRDSSILNGFALENRE